MKISLRYLNSFVKNELCAPVVIISIFSAPLRGHQLDHYHRNDETVWIFVHVYVYAYAYVYVYTYVPRKSSDL